MRSGLVALALLLAAAPAHGAFKNTQFQTPSKKITCGYVTGSEGGNHIRCDLLFLNDRAVILEESGKARKIKVTDAIGDPRSQVLAYGTSKKFGKFTCRSETTGLTCTKGKHGFEVSRQVQRVF